MRCLGFSSFNRFSGFIYPSVCRSIYLWIDLIWLSIDLWIYRSVCLSVRLSVCLSVCPSVCLSVYLSTRLSSYLSINLPTYLSIPALLGLSQLSPICLCLLTTVDILCFSVFWRLSSSHPAQGVHQASPLSPKRGSGFWLGLSRGNSETLNPKP